MSSPELTLPALLEALRPHEGSLRLQMRPVLDDAATPPWQRLAPVAALSALDGDARAEAISALLQEHSAVLRSLGVHLMIEGGHEGWLPAAMRSLSIGADELLATWLVVAVGRLGAWRYFSFVEAALEAPPTFWAAVEALSLLGGPEARRCLEAAIARFEDSWDRLDVLMVIARVGGDFANPLLLQLLRDVDEPAALRGFAAQALGARGALESMPALVAALSDSSLTEKGRVLWALGALGQGPSSAAAFDAVLPWLEAAGKDWWRGEALKTLASLDPERARPLVVETALHSAFFRSDLQRFSDVLLALGQVGGSEATAILADTVVAWAGLGREGTRAYSAPPAVSGAKDRFGVTLLDALGAACGAQLPQARGGKSPAQVVRMQAEALAACCEGRLLLDALEAIRSHASTRATVHPALA